MATHAKYSRSWHLWQQFLTKIPTDDIYLVSFTQNQRNTIISVFLDTVKNGEFNKQGRPVQGNTARQTTDHVCKIIESCGWPDPRVNTAGKVCIQITRQLRTYKSNDPATHHQKAIPPEVYRWLLRHANGPRQQARAHLLAGALFFAMRSCEYTKTRRVNEQKTRAIRAKDIVFRNEAEIIPHNDPRIFIAETVVITFNKQKNGIVDDSISADSSNDMDLCPVKHWATTISRLRSYPNYSDAWPVYCYFDPNTNKMTSISSTEIFDDIKAAVDAIGEKTLGFTSKDVGTHSNRSGFAMMLYLSGYPILTIMLLGRWLSNAFLRYIEKQVHEFSKGVSQKMLTHNTFYNIPVRPWTNTDTANSQSAGRFIRPVQRQIIGQHQHFGSLRDAHRS